jgi:hypothetical protein
MSKSSFDLLGVSAKASFARSKTKRGKSNMLETPASVELKRKRRMRS